MNAPLSVRIVFASALLLAAPGFAAAADYADAEAAYRDGIGRLKQMQFEEAREPLEAALQLAPDDAFRFKVNQTLLQVYRRVPEAEPMIGAAEFVIGHTDNRVERGLNARGLTSFLYQRGLLDREVAKHEATLKTDADDLVALAMLIAAYGGPKRDEARKSELAERLLKLEQAASADQAQRLEALAKAEPARAAQHWKDAAVAWRDASNNDAALAAAAAAEQADPKPAGLLLHFYHRHLGEVFADCGKSAQAIAHLEKAVAATTIKGYQDDCQARIFKLKAASIP